MLPPDDAQPTVVADYRQELIESLTLGACVKDYSSCLVCLCMCGRNNFPRLLVAASDSAYRKYMPN